MGSRQVIMATLLTALAVTSYQVRELQKAASDAARPAASIPALEATPALSLAKPAASGIGSADLWQLKAPSLQGNLALPPLQDLFKPFYSLSKDGRFQGIKRSDRPSEQWEFQGVVVRDGNLRALFYNPGLKRLKNLGRGELVDDRLAVRSVAQSSVIVEVVGEKKPQKFELRLFNANKESYAAKKKTL